MICTVYWTHSIFVKHILLHFHGSLPTRVRFLHSWAIFHYCVRRLLCTSGTKIEFLVPALSCCNLQVHSLLHRLRPFPHISPSMRTLALLSTCRSGIFCFPASGVTPCISQACTCALRLLRLSMALLHVNVSQLLDTLHFLLAVTASFVV